MDRLVNILSSSLSGARALLARLDPRVQWVLLAPLVLLARVAWMALLVLLALLVPLALLVRLVRKALQALMDQISTGRIPQAIGATNFATKLLQAMGFKSTSPKSPDPE